MDGSEPKVRLSWKSADPEIIQSTFPIPQIQKVLWTFDHCWLKRLNAGHHTRKIYNYYIQESSVFTLRPSKNGILTLQLLDLESIWYHGGLHYYVMVNLRKDFPLRVRILKICEHFRYRQVALTDGRHMILAEFCRENDDLHSARVPRMLRS